MRTIPNEEGEPIKTAPTDQSLEKTEAVANNNSSRRICPLSDEMVKLLVKQLGSELSNYHLYRTFAAYFSAQGLPKLEQYFIARADEENHHHNWIFWYLNYNDAEYMYPEIKAVDIKIPNRVFPFTATVDREIETTLGINKIVDHAMKEGDWATFNWLMGDDDEKGRLVKEQVEEESISRTIANMAQEDTDWLTKEDTILSFYRNPSYDPNQEVEDDD